MWRSCILVVLQLAVPVAAIAQQLEPQPSQPACAVPADPGWTAQEAFVWERLCAGETADLNAAPAFGGRLDAKSPEHWPDSRTLRPAFLESILLKEPYRQALSRRGVAIVGAQFAAPVDLSEAVLTCPLLLQDSVFAQGANLLRLRSEYSLDLDGSNFKSLSLNAARLMRLSLRGAVVAGEVNLAVAQIAGNIQLHGSRFAGLVDLSGMHVGGFLLIEKDAELQNLKLHTTYIEKDLQISGSKIARVLDMSGIRIGGSLIISDHAILDGVNLLNAQVEKEFEVSASTISGRLDMNRLQVGGLLSIHQTRLNGLTLRSAELGQLEILSSKVGGQVDCSGMQVRGEASLSASEFADAVKCPAATIKGDAVLNGAIFDADVDLTKSEIDGALQLKDTTWRPETTLRLANAKLGLVDLGKSWPPHLELDGLTYRSADSPEAHEAWFGRLPHFAPQPYDQLASVVRSAGKDDLATTIRYSGRQRERNDERKWIPWGWLYILEGSIGYGFYPLRALLSVVGFVGLGALVLRLTGEGPRNGMPVGLAYSFDLLLPIVRLRESHYAIDLRAPARYYFYFHKIMGYLLASFVIAGVSGLTR
jgi:hypothetical protein